MYVFLFVYNALYLCMEKEMAPHSSTLAWKIPWIEKLGRLQSTGLLRVGYDWATSLSCIGEGNGNPLQCSCLENPRDRGAWWAAIYGVTHSQQYLCTWTFYTQHRCINPRVHSENHVGFCSQKDPNSNIGYWVTLSIFLKALIPTLLIWGLRTTISKHLIEYSKQQIAFLFSFPISPSCSNFGPSF